MIDQSWLHGTSLYFTEWTMPNGPLRHKGGIEAHRAIFFTMDEQFARLSADGGRGLCSARLLSGAKVLDMNRVAPAASEAFRLRVAQKKWGRKNLQVQHREYWTDGWRTGRIMKYAAPESEQRLMQEKALLARNAKHTPAGVACFNELQKLTRDCIEELVESARELGYDAVIGNEIADQKTYSLLFVLNEKMLTPPEWREQP